MKLLRKYAKKWAMFVREDSKALPLSLFLASAGAFNFYMYFSGRLDEAAVLASGVFLLSLSALLFERAGFVELLTEKNDSLQKNMELE